MSSTSIEPYLWKFACGNVAFTDLSHDAACFYLLAIDPGGRYDELTVYPEANRYRNPAFLVNNCNHATFILTKEGSLRWSDGGGRSAQV